MYKCGCKTTETWTKANKNTHPRLDGLDLEVQTDETEDETFQILDQVVEHTEALRVPAGEIVFISKSHFPHWPSCCLEYSLTLTGWHQSGNQSWKLWKKCVRLRWQSPVPVEISQKHRGPSYTSEFSCYAISKFKVSLERYTITYSKSVQLANQPRTGELFHS